MHRFIDDLLQILHVDVDVDDDNKERFVLVSDTALVFNKYRPEQYRRSSSSSLSSTSVQNTSKNDKENDRWNAKSSQKRRNMNVQKEMSDSCLTIPKRSWSSSPTMTTTDSCLIIPKRTSWSKNNRNNNSKQLMAEMKYSNVSIPRLNNGDKIQQTNNTAETVSTTTTIERITSASDDAASSLSAAAEPTEPLVGRRRKRDSIYLHKQRYQHDIKE
ncbi:hypothetical protein FRACYDRAFT_261957 [Fragilariopsis cylindrus CCMP1102]|uniref:Uncharacterized protein n=1 Tax=Fragilariopsis cylindrus CCMP1102 TaxID=635003 RepID=A0A1E7F851_9STRA|nr:hypothetical protein FRACYDRAFT_261957 [Fragilariopsis cylindrus CCMP1102]|eukprot:OEU14372.1 hypothetical protein FRACYDRAFT_261957 [Fragilariopsis cylindrus CCMP1102]